MVFLSRNSFKGVLAGILVIQFLLLTMLPAGAATYGSSELSFASGAFRKVWDRPDLPVYQGRTSRSYTWGPEGWSFEDEDYEESPGGKRLVQYFDKTRMEISNPNADPNGRYFVTNGLLVKEMVAGQVQVGDTLFQASSPAEVPVAGDAVNNPSPTYLTFKNIASLNLDKRSPHQTGQFVTATLNREGAPGNDPDLANKYKVKLAQYDDVLGHNIPDVFWTFMNQQGPVYENGQYPTAPVIDWLSTMGLPLAEPSWSEVVVAGKKQDVLIQLFERRVLTYTPANPAAFRVEMGNVGAHYYAWRYPGADRLAPWAKITITNKLSCGTITVTFKGQDNLSVDIPAQTSKDYNLGPGTYTYSARGCNSIGAEESHEFQARRIYTLDYTGISGVPKKAEADDFSSVLA